MRLGLSSGTDTFQNNIFGLTHNMINSFSNRMW